MRRPAVIALCLSLVGSLGALGWLTSRASRAADTLARAEALLVAPFDRAPELHDLAAGDALATLDAALEDGADVPPRTRHYAEALANLQRGDLLEAEGAMSAARHAAGWSVELHVLAAAIGRASGNRAAALDHVGAALALDPDAPRALLLEADLALDAGDGPVAARTLERLLEQASRVAALHNRLGLARELLGEAEAAEVAFRRALALDDATPEAWVNLGRTLRARGALDEAALAFAAALEHAESDAAAWLGRGLCALDQGRLLEARESLERAHELALLAPAGHTSRLGAPHGDTIALALADLAALDGEHARAAEGYRLVLRSRPHHASAWAKLGNALVRLGDHEDARAAFEAALEAAEQAAGVEAAAWNGLGAAFAALGRLDEAAEALGRAATLDVDDPNPWLNLGLLHERRGDRDLAADAWRQALARAPEHPVALARAR
ncbi:MAG: tetratricopeptide repeat protein [Myxococcales bacterium]|nr:tetratricopeptide repeat protein [Myxococcales bacterium]